MQIISYLLWSVLCILPVVCRAQTVLPLYEGKIPDAKPAVNEERIVPNALVDTIAVKVSVPTLKVFLPPRDQANGTAVIICPGGGYGALLINREGSKVAEAFRKLGVAAFVLKYRLPSDRTMVDKSIGPLEDAQQAIRMVRSHAGMWHIDTNRIGIMGFSAGGHLAASAGTHFNHAFIPDQEGTSLRPDFMLLIYPVISFTDSIGHVGSRNNLLGPHPSGKQIRFFSNELQVTHETPPAMLIQAAGDSVVPSQNSLYFYEALRAKGVQTALHLYAKGEHGFLTAPSFDKWFSDCVYWMRGNGWVR